MKPARLLVVMATLLAGCSTAAPVAPLGLKDSCDALGAVAERYAEFLPKFQAVQARGDATTKEAFQPYIDLIAKGAGGANVFADQVAVSFKLDVPTEEFSVQAMKGSKLYASIIRAEAG